MDNKSLYIGIMSGTSFDAIDVALCSIDKNSCKLIKGIEYPFESSLKLEILETIRTNQTSIIQIAKIDLKLGKLFAKSVNHLLSKTNMDAKEIIAIGSHGQTIWHDPSNQITMQLGDPNIITTQTNIKVVADFRRKDIALGGQGAPFAPAFHQFLFKEAGESIAIVNIGGMANITIIGEELMGYDTGCGNVLLDMWIAKHKGSSYDRDGEWAKRGQVEYKLLKKMLDDSYFHQAYPKSTGREKFNAQWLEEMIAEFQISPIDIQRTLLELTAISISNEVLKFQKDILVLCGGGAKNSFLVERFKSVMPNIEMVIANNADSLEAMAFAWLAYKRINGEVVELKDVTGARENGVLGGIYE